MPQAYGQADDQVTVKLYNLAKTDKNDAITEIFKSKAILLGSPTVNNGFLVSVAALLEEIKGLKFKKKTMYNFGEQTNLKKSRYENYFTVSGHWMKSGRPLPALWLYHQYRGVSFRR